MSIDGKAQRPIRITERDIERYEEMARYEAKLRGDGYGLIAGVDEAGRGPLAGPVVAAACILPEGETFYGLNDSKKMTERRRDALFVELRRRALAWSVALVTNCEIDRVNILEATKEAMKQALRTLPVKPDVAVIDAVALDGLDYPVMVEKRGDARINAIAAASILAKVTRDRLMKNWDAVYPVYGFSSNKGYGTKEHMDAIRLHGSSPIHRLSFLGNILNDPEIYIDRGVRIEHKVAEDLIARGHTILEHRYSIHEVGEVDFITSRKDEIFVIECKGRGPSSSAFGGVDEAFSAEQADRIRLVVVKWLEEKGLTDVAVEMLYAAVDTDCSGDIMDIRYMPFM
ncbi:MAG TPA: ribonuclease HII [Clostridiaceae bacterium]|nr:ribonuclease HII [Clostridiaceae bacterium]